MHRNLSRIGFDLYPHKREDKHGTASRAHKNDLIYYEFRFQVESKNLELHSGLWSEINLCV